MIDDPDRVLRIGTDHRLLLRPIKISRRLVSEEFFRPPQVSSPSVRAGHERSLCAYLYLRAMGRAAEAVEQCEAPLETDPLHPRRR